MKEKLKKALKAAGLNEGLADFINITSEDQIEGVVNMAKSTQQSTELDFNKVLSSTEFSNFVEKEGFDKVVEISKPLQSGHDKKVTAGITTFKDKYFKDIDPSKGKEGKTEPGEGDSETLKLVKELKKEIEGLKNNNQQSDKLAQATEVFKKSKVIPEKLQKKWGNRIDFDSETSIEDQVKALEDEYTESYQDLVGESFGKGLPTGGPTGGAKASDEEVDELAEDF